MLFRRCLSYLNERVLREVGVRKEGEMRNLAVSIWIVIGQKLFPNLFVIGVMNIRACGCSESVLFSSEVSPNIATEVQGISFICFVLISRIFQFLLWAKLYEIRTICDHEISIHCLNFWTAEIFFSLPEIECSQIVLKLSVHSIGKSSLNYQPSFRPVQVTFSFGIRVGPLSGNRSGDCRYSGNI